MLTTYRPLTIHSWPWPVQEIEGYSIVRANSTKMHRSWYVGSHASRHKLGENITSDQWYYEDYPGKKRSAVPTTRPTIIGSSVLSQVVVLWRIPNLGLFKD